MVNLTFCSYVQEFTQNEVRELIAKYEFLVPKWCYEIHVWYDADDPSICAISIQEDYRRASLSLGTKWHDSVTHDDDILHELCHFYNGGIGRVAKDAIEMIVGNDFPTPGSKIAFDHITQAVERCNGDLIHLIKGMTNGK